MKPIYWYAIFALVAFGMTYYLANQKIGHAEKLKTLEAESSPSFKAINSMISAVENSD